MVKRILGGARVARDSPPPNDNDAKVYPMLALCASTVFLSALLLFWIQPMFTKSVLPLLGGSPSVWNTALVFFQATLLLGYLYVHGTARLLGFRAQTAVHLVVLASAFLVLPIGIAAGWTPPTDALPIPWVL